MIAGWPGVESFPDTKGKIDARLSNFCHLTPCVESDGKFEPSIPLICHSVIGTIFTHCETLTFIKLVEIHYLKNWMFTLITFVHSTRVAKVYVSLIWFAP